MMGFFVFLFVVNWVVFYMIWYVSFERGRDAARREFVETIEYCDDGLKGIDASEHGPWEEGYKTAIQDIRDYF